MKKGKKGVLKKYCKIFKNTYFEEHLGTAASNSILHAFFYKQRFFQLSVASVLLNFLINSASNVAYVLLIT